LAKPRRRLGRSQTIVRANRRRAGKCYHCKPDFGHAVNSASRLSRQSEAYAVDERYDASVAKTEAWSVWMWMRDMDVDVDVDVGYGIWDERDFL